MKDLLETLVYFIVILSAILAGIRGLYKIFHKRRKLFSKRICGNWSNEGNITDSSRSHNLNLSLSTKDCKVGGILEVSNLESGSYHNNLSVSGKIRLRKKIKITFVDVHHGELEVYGSAMLRLKGGSMRWKLQKGRTQLFPTETILWRIN